ncbi:MAG: hypothetical protein K6A62_03890 [Bacteroidales bacterium]|nr:hypothetical protein [Bacteroidales bacterium]
MRHFFLTVCALLLACFVCSGQGNADKLPPAWLGTTPSSGVNGVEFVRVSGIFAPYRQNVTAQALNKLAQNLPGDWNVSSRVTGKESTRIDRNGGEITGSSRSQISTLEVIADGEPVNIRCMLVDEYWKPQGKGSGNYEYNAIYQVARYEDAVFPSTILTTKYGAQGLWRSAIVPGWGQMHKGSYLKGGLIMGGTVGLASGIVIAENMRSAYAVKASTTHSTTAAKQYQANISNATTARNICIGGLAALYIYNLIDAVAAPGARRIVVTPAVYGNGSYGIGSSINF